MNGVCWLMTSQVDEGVVLKNRQDTREYRINTDGKQPLWEMDKILDIWPKPPIVRQLNIFIDRPVGAVSPTQPEYSLPLPPREYYPYHCILFTHIGISECIFAKQYGFTFI